MVAELFSNNHKEMNFLENTKLVGFYSNDGVCFFKYFIKENDPQRLYVWIILTVNFVCFLFISISYTTIKAVGANEDEERPEELMRMRKGLKSKGA